MFSIRNACRTQLEIDSIDYDKLDRYVSGTLHGLPKAAAHNFFKMLRSHNTEKANREFVNGANLARGFIRDALNGKIHDKGAPQETKVRNVKFQTDGAKVRVSVDVDGVAYAFDLLKEEIERAGVSETSVQTDGSEVRVTLDDDSVVQALNGVLYAYGILCSGVSAEG